MVDHRSPKSHHSKGLIRGGIHVTVERAVQHRGGAVYGDAADGDEKDRQHRDPEEDLHQREPRLATGRRQAARARGG